MGQNKLGDAPGPKGLPLLGNILDLRGNLLQVLIDMHARYGDLFQYRLGPYQFYNLNHPDYARHVLINRKGQYIKDGRSSKQIRLLAGQSLLTDNGSGWQSKRDLLQDTFRVDSVRQFADVVISETRELIRHWRSASMPIEIHPTMMKLTYQIIGKALFSVDLEHSSKQVENAMASSLAFLYRRIFGWSLPLAIRTPENQKFIAERDKLHKLVDAIIEKRQTTGKIQHDLLDKMNAAHQANLVFNNTWLRDEAVTLLLAGHETTANALSWIWYLLATHPEVEQQVYREIMGHFPGDIDDINKLANLHYTHMVFNEALRLYPPIWSIERYACNDDEIGGFRINKGASVFVSIYTLHRHRDFWTEPDKFLPERFSERRTAADAYMPFGLGQRMCLGKNFAIQEAMIILIIVMQQCRLSRADNRLIQPEPGITLRMNDKLMLNVNWRSQS